jgi:sulfide:quinone oxidoreductase
LGTPIPPAPDASKAVLAAFAERGIEWHPGHLVGQLVPGVARFDDGTEMPFDLFIGVPEHRVPDVVAESGLCVDGWIPVDPITLARQFPTRVRRGRRRRRDPSQSGFWARNGLKFETDRAQITFGDEVREPRRCGRR